MNKKKKRNLLAILITPSQFEHFLKTGKYEVESPVPKDAEYLNSRYDWERDSFIVIFRHKIFKEVKEGELIPISEKSITVKKL